MAFKSILCSIIQALGTYLLSGPFLIQMLKFFKAKNTRHKINNTVAKTNEIFSIFIKISLICNIFEHQLYNIWLSLRVDGRWQNVLKAHLLWLFVFRGIRLRNIGKAGPVELRGPVLSLLSGSRLVHDVRLIQIVVKQWFLRPGLNKLLGTLKALRSSWPRALRTHIHRLRIAFGDHIRIVIHINIPVTHNLSKPHLRRVFFKPHGASARFWSVDTPSHLVLQLLEMVKLHLLVFVENTLFHQLDEAFFFIPTVVKVV